MDFDHARGRGPLKRLYHSSVTPPRVRDAYRRLRRRVFVLRQLTHLAAARLSRTPPETFSGKLHHKLAFDRRPLLTTFADKLAARDHVLRTLGPGYLPELYLAAGRADAIQPEALPRDFALKAAHASGGVVVVSDAARPGAELPPSPAGWPHAAVTPDRVDWTVLRRLAGEWLGRGYHASEWAYRGVPRRVLAEEAIVEDGRHPLDYRVYVFNGRARLVHVDQDRFARQTRVFYTPGWEPLDIELRHPRGRPVGRPPRLADMLAAAEELARPTDFVRVDFYAPGDRLVVGELTSYPGGGEHRVEPPEADLRIGLWWSLPGRYVQEEIDRLARRAEPERVAG
jgi:hypothetical protein